MNDLEFDVAVVGGGVVGLLSAVLLAELSLEVAMIAEEFDPSPPVGDIELRCYAITPGSRAILEALGVWRGVDRSRVGEFHSMCVWDAASSGRIRFDPPVIHEGPMGWIIEHQNLIAALAANLEGRGSVSFHRQAMTRLLASDRPVAVLEDGATVRARLFVGADGAASRVRDATGIAVKRAGYEHTAVVCNVVSEKPHAGIARQRFLSSGPLAFLPLADACCCSIVWSCTDELAREIKDDSNASFCARLETAIEGRLGAIKAVSPRSAFPLERLRAARSVHGSCVLVGDAAHVIHPLAGQGVNLGIMDAAALAECIGPSIGAAHWPRPAALRRYERWRASETLAMACVTDGLKRLFQSDASPVRLLRGAGMRMTDRLPLLKEWVIGRAMGTRGDLPRTVRPFVDTREPMS
ncbi:MAG: FAD-dependent monooxygenase [Pseudomonadota bacterium]|nr:FAD-dependent monooxygenase [Pseudomonadota bacterium]